MHPLVRLAPALMALSVLAAGCVELAPSEPSEPLGAADLAAPTAAVVHGVGARALDPARSAGMPATMGAQLSTGADSFEPTIGVTSGGVLFMTAYDERGRTRAPSVVRSVDRGLTWEDAGPKLPTGDGNPPFTNDPYVYVDPLTDRVFMLDLYLLVCSYMSWSDGLGETWTTNPAACGTPLANDHQTMVTAKPRTVPTVGYPNVVYYCVNRVADSACATSLTGGLTWNPLVTVYPGVEANGQRCGGLHGHAASGPDGKVYLPKAQCGVPMVAVTEDDGRTWTRHVISEDVRSYGHEVRVAVDEDNHVHAIWIGEDGLPYQATSVDGGKTWTSARMVAPPGVTATDLPAIAAGAGGRIAFVYIGTTIEGGYEGKNTGHGGLTGDILGEPEPAEWANATWNAYIGVMEDATAENPVIMTVTANDPVDPIARGLCGRTRCGGMGDFLDVDVDAEGRPWAAFVDVCTRKCVTDPAVKKDEAVGFAGTLVEGPALRGPAGSLPTLVHESAGAPESRARWG